MKKFFMGLAIFLASVAVTGALALCTNNFTSLNPKDYKDNLEALKEVDDARLTVTVDAMTAEEQDIYLYVEMGHTKLTSAEKVLGNGMGISLAIEAKEDEHKDAIKFIEAKEKGEVDQYEIDLTGYLPLQYDNVTEFLEEGGFINVKVSYYADEAQETVVESLPVMITEAGNYDLSYPTENGGTVEVVHTVLYKSVLGSIFTEKFVDEEESE